jgi:hypothetical protein
VSSTEKYTQRPKLHGRTITNSQAPRAKHVTAMCLQLVAYNPKTARHCQAINNSTQPHNAPSRRGMSIHVEPCSTISINAENHPTTRQHAMECTQKEKDLHKRRIQQPGTCKQCMPKSRAAPHNAPSRRGMSNHVKEWGKSSGHAPTCCGVTALQCAVHKKKKA